MPHPTLDWKSRHDPESLNYPIRTLLTPTPRVDRLWTPGPVLDQGQEGACVGFAWASEAVADPIPVNLDRLAAHTPRTWELYARFLYAQAQWLDEWAGQAYEGTSVLAGAKASQNTGVLRSYRWAFGLDDVVDTVIQRGPVVLGTNWYSGMYAAPGGRLALTGTLVGGHAYLAVGYKTSAPELGGAPGVVVKNSWGKSWGINGLATISLPDLTLLLRQDGEACVPVSRSYGR